MWKKTLGLALLALLLSLTLQGCYSHRRARGYRGDYAPGYVHVQVRTAHGYRVVPRAHRHSYRVRHHDEYPNNRRHFRKFKHKDRYQEHRRRHR